MELKVNKLDIEHIKNKVGKAMDCQFEVYSWNDMIGDTDLTMEEKQWAISNLSYKVIEFKKNYKEQAIKAITDLYKKE